jgi:hypothetical protein
MAAIRFALFKIAVDAPHLICGMGKTQDGLFCDLHERVRRSGFHFDCHQFPFAHCVDRRLNFTERQLLPP